MNISAIPFDVTDWSGVLRTELEDGRRFTLKPSMGYQFSDNDAPHRSYTETGAKLFIVD